MSTSNLDLIMLIASFLVFPLAGVIVLMPRITRAYDPPPWARIALWTGLIALVLWSGLGIFQGRFEAAGERERAVFKQVWMFLGGFAVGVLFTLRISGTFATNRAKNVAGEQ